MQAPPGRMSTKQRTKPDMRSAGTRTRMQQSFMVRGGRIHLGEFHWPACVQRAMSFSVRWCTLWLIALLTPLALILFYPRFFSLPIRPVVYVGIFGPQAVWTIFYFRSQYLARQLVRAAQVVDGYACLRCGFPVGDGVQTDTCPECGNPYHAEVARGTWRSMGGKWWKQPNKPD